MKTSRLLLAAFLLLAMGTFLLCNFTHGNAGFDFSTNIPDTKLNLNLTTTGWPAFVGFPCFLIGVFLLCASFFSAIVKEILMRTSRKSEPIVSAPLE